MILAAGSLPAPGAQFLRRSSSFETAAFGGLLGMRIMD
jgi:hypothetical protein